MEAAIETVRSKVCKRCQKEKPASDYYTHALSNDGLQSWCKVCCLENSKKRAEEIKRNGRKPIVTKGITSLGKKCIKCGDFKSLEDYHRKSLAPDGRAGTCKVCKRKQEAERREGLRANQAPTNPVVEAVVQPPKPVQPSLLAPSVPPQNKQVALLVLPEAKKVYRIGVVMDTAIELYFNGNRFVVPKPLIDGLVNAGLATRMDA